EGDGAEEGEGGGPGIAPGAVGARGVGIADAEEEEGDEREHVVGDEEEGQHGDDAFEFADGEDDADEGAEEQGDGGSAAFVHACDLMEEQAVAAHRVDYASSHQMQRVDGAEKGHDDDGTKYSVAVAAEDALRGEAKRKIVAGDLVHGKNVEDGGVD